MPRKKADPAAPKAPRPAPPRRRKNDEVRGREYLTPAEVVRLATAASKVGRHGHRDALMVRMADRHGFRVTELVNLRRDQVDFTTGLLHVRRAKRGVPSTHPLAGWEVRDLRRLFKDKRYREGPYVFSSERGGPLTEAAVRKFVARAGVGAGIAFPVHPHMLRHACGHRLVNEGRDTRSIQQFLGHRNIQHTVKYTELAPDRFKGWVD